MADLMPITARCHKCSRTLPVRAQMNLDSGDKIPLLVVLSEVGSVEEALVQAICQVCLHKTGSADRGLYEVLMRLGLKNGEDEAKPPSDAAVVVYVRQEHAAPLVGVVVSSSRPREVSIVDPLTGQSIQVTRPTEPSVRDRRSHGECRDDWRFISSESCVPRNLREAEHISKPSAAKKHLTGAIGRSGDNAAVLEAAMAGICKRDEERRLERAKKFDKLIHWLRLTLAKIRNRAKAQEVWGLVDTFERKIGEAANLDAHNRGKKGVLAVLGTSAEDLEGLCLQCYSPWERLRILNPEVVTMDAFEGGRRPESWDLRGGKRPTFYEFEVVRTKSSLAVPNPSLPGGDGDSCLRIVYPKGGEYGNEHTTLNSRRDPQIDMICSEVTRLLACWFARRYVELDIRAECSKFDFPLRLIDFIGLLKHVLAREEAQALIEQVDHEELDILCLELPATK